MRRLLLTENITADGRVEMLDDWFDPSPERGAGDLQDEMERQGSTCDAVLLGRKTFEDFRAYWPHHTDEPPGAYLDRVQKWVVSSSMADPRWHGTTVLAGDPVDAVRRLKDADGGDIMLTGSIRLTHTALAAGLVDEVRLFVHPAVQGRGRGLVAEGTSLPVLELLQATAFRGGVVLLRYAVRHPGEPGVTGPRAPR